MLHSLLYDWLKSREPLWSPEAGSVDDLMTSVLNAVAIFPQPSVNPYRALLGRIGAFLKRVRFRLARVMDTLGLRRTLYMLGLIKRHEISS